MVGIDPFGGSGSVEYQQDTRMYQMDAEHYRKLMAQQAHNAFWGIDTGLTGRNSKARRYRRRMLKMKEAEVERRLRPVYKALWIAAYGWGAMLLIALTAWIFRFTVYSALS